VSPRTRLAITAALFSTGGAAIKWTAFSGWQLAAFRALIAGAVIFLMLPEARRGWSWRTLLVSCAYAATTLLYVQANKHTTAANTVFLQATSPLFVLVMAPLLLSESVTRRDVAQIVVMGLGMTLFFTGAQRHYATAPNPGLGNILAGICAITWALTVVGYRWVVKHGGHVATAAVGGNLLACAIALSQAWPLVPGAAKDWLVVVYLGTTQLGLAYVFFARALPQVTALNASLLLLIEPVLNPIWAWLVHGEAPSLMAVIGGSIILGANVGRSIVDARSPRLLVEPVEAGEA
jgi:drug/metabolite transporter (DMT)-like permease